MKKALLIGLFLLLQAVLLQVTGYADFMNKLLQADNLPVPNEVKNLLFYIQRDPDANTVVYQLNLGNDGKLQENEPIKAFWIRYAEKGARQELNYIQRKFAFGVNCKKLARDNYEVTFVSYNKLKLYLRKNNQNQYHIYTTVNKKLLILKRVFVRIEGGTFWVPNVLYIELKGIDTATGKTVAERIKP